MHAQVGSNTERTYVYNSQRERLWGDVAHDQPRLHHGKAEVICYRQAVFQLVENVWNILPPSRLLKHNHVLPQTNGAVFQVFIVSPSSTLCMSRMFISVLPHKENKLHPIYRTIKSQDNFNVLVKTVCFAATNTLVHAL